MGLIFSRFRPSKSTIETLENIEREIKRLQQQQRHNQHLQKKVAASLLLYSILLYVVASVLFYFLYFPEKWQDRALYLVPLLIFPFLVWGAKKLLHWYFVNRLSANELAVQELREKKAHILEDVMETETYKKAKEILERFDPVRFKALKKTETSTVVTCNKVTGVRQRVQPVLPRVISPHVAQPVTSTPQSVNRSQPQHRISPVPNPVMPLRYSTPPGPPMPRTVLPRDRGTVDKLIDYLVGDGPENRYALICCYCKSHNGMALPEEFEYLSFRCCYCYNLNQARKIRPFAPRLEVPEAPSPAKPLSESMTGDSENDKDTKNTKEEVNGASEDASCGDERTAEPEEQSATPSSSVKPLSEVTNTGMPTGSSTVIGNNDSVQLAS